MKEVRHVVKINLPAEEVFDFTTNPESTPLWIDSIVKEEVDSQPIKIGTIYRNWDRSGKMNEYVVAKIERGKVFQLESTLEDYKVRYTYTPISDTETELEYYEWSEEGEIHLPFPQEILNKLKEVIEERNI